MAATLLSNVIVPEIFQPYMVERTATLSALFQSGIISRDPGIETSMAGGGWFVKMPFWADLTGDDEKHDDTTDFTVGGHTTAQDVAALIARGKAWGVSDLAVELAGSDPFRALADRLAAYWARKQQTTLINALGGAFAAASMSGNVHDITGAAGALANITGSTFIDAQQKLGDAADRLVAVAMHSATRAQLAKNDLIDTLRDRDGNLLFQTFMGKRVIVDDGLPVATSDYTTYLFGEGAIGYGEVTPKVAIEFARDALGAGGQDILVSRRHYVLHPRGVKWGVTTANPTNAQLATGTNWARVYENKNIRVVQFKHKLNAS